METSFEVRSCDAHMKREEYDALPKHPLYIVLDNLRSAFNVGAIFRLCDAMRVQGLLLCGYTAHPPHVKLEKTSLGTIEYVPWQWFPDAMDAVAWLREREIAVWAAETCSHAIPYTQAAWPERAAIVLGNEALGVRRDVLEACDTVVEIPLYGFKNSVNVATACAVVGFAFVEHYGRTKAKAPMPTAQVPSRSSDEIRRR
jgi:tRNA G18 (ribose-2'-O)-methylase SpoU